MISLLHDLWSQTVDQVAFGAINTLQRLQRGGTHDRKTFETYLAQWRGASPEDYYALPEIPLLQLPENGVAKFPTTHPTGCAENDQLHIEIWRGPHGKKSPAMILLHGFMSVSDVGYRIWARHLNNLGWTAVFFHLPYHYERRPRGTLSGEIAITANLIRTAEAIRQGVKDLRLICRSLRAQGSEKIGCWATSYGGWLASLLCLVEKNLDTAWLIEPITDVEHVLWTSPAAKTMRRQLQKENITPDLLQPHLPLVCPSFHTPLTPANQILLVAGIFDQIAPPASIQKLHTRWTGSHYAELRQGHVGYQLMPASWRLAQTHIPNLFQ